MNMMPSNLELKGGGKRLRTGRKKRIYTIHLPEADSLLDRPTAYWAIGVLLPQLREPTLLSILLWYREGDGYEGGRIEFSKSNAEALVALALSYEYKFN